MLGGRMYPHCVHCIQPQTGSAIYISERVCYVQFQRGPPAQHECFLMIMKWFIVIYEMSTAYLPRAGQGQVRNRILK